MTSWEGIELANYSVLDSQQFIEQGADLMIPRGYGTFLATYAKDVEVRLRTPVTRIRWNGRGVAAETPAGTFTARVAIVALPTSVITAGAVIFSPYLPVEVLQAHHDLPLGVMNKVALRFKRNVFPSAGTGSHDAAPQRRPRPGIPDADLGRKFLRRILRPDAWRRNSRQRARRR